MTDDHFSNSLEIWKAILDYPGYEVSDQGRVRSYLKRTYHKGTKGCHWVLDNHPQRTLKPKFTVGYLTVSLCKEGRRDTINTHRLVLLTFVGLCPPGMEACHDDGIRCHCALSNLRWDTISNNHLDKRKHGTMSCGESSGMSKLTENEIHQIREMSAGYRTIAELFSISYGHVGKIKRREMWAHI